MDLRQLIVENIDLIIDPVTIKMSAPEFIAEFGGTIERINIVAKHASGNVFYDSEVAPKDTSIGDFFSKFVDVAGDILDVYAVINTLVDSYRAMDSKYASFKSGFKKSETHICPVVDQNINYLGEIIKEVAKFPIKGIILTGNTFVNYSYCFCESCRKEFSVISGLSEEFDYNRIGINKDLLEKWTKWKSDNINSMLNHLVNLAKQVNDELDVSVEVYWDPSTNFKEQMELEYGQNMDDLTSKFNTVLNIYPWAPVLPEVGSNEYTQLLDDLTFTKGLARKGLDFSILYWNIADEKDVEVMKALGNELGAKKIYSYNSYPPNYTELREAHLGR
ncbi:MAG: hypothetical protein ACTSQY_02155 [Candidatus Odinarchaeia archaeon]